MDFLTFYGISLLAFVAMMVLASNWLKDEPPNSEEFSWGQLAILVLIGVCPIINCIAVFIITIYCIGKFCNWVANWPFWNKPVWPKKKD